MTAHGAMLWLPDALRAAGLTVWELDGWQENERGYFWTRPDGGNDGYDGFPTGAMWHHTATSSYTPVVRNSKGQTKANMWVGLRRGDRLYQDGGGEATIALTSSGPANYSSGNGVRAVLDQWVIPEIPMEIGCPSGDDNPTWAGNRYYWNTEIVCDGVGSMVAPEVLDTIAIAMSVLTAGMGWNPNQARHIQHSQHTRRKIDYRDGRWVDSIATIVALRSMAQDGGNVFAQYVRGLVETWAEDPVKTEDEFMRLASEDLLGGDVDYWMSKLGDPSDPEWVGFVGRTMLSSWHRPT